ncbi:hypothetical protein [Agrococcus carbonis]|uniref:Uncharacterized protein n=1 Tax=Agrococcus carbonis TaxID=684552 RepID=A0A1H1QEJ7_9MICO|nr:hypothetical protein [Agrococcus carbonis]SDS21743.1 hypothetical protein SAMN04489719_1814 [Agrococcus carbonis]
MPESWWGNAIFSLIPTIVLGLLFWMVLRSIIRGDRTARSRYDRIEAEERAKLGLPPKGAAPAPGTESAPAADVAAPAPAASAPDAGPGAPAPGERTE